MPFPPTVPALTLTPTTSAAGATSQSAWATAMQAGLSATVDFATELDARVDARGIWATDYGVLADGVTNDRDNLQTAVAAAIAAQVDLWLPDGNILVTFTSTTPGTTDRLAITGNLTIRSRGLTTITFGPNVPTFGYSGLYTSPGVKFQMWDVTLQGPIDPNVGTLPSTYGINIIGSASPGLVGDGGEVRLYNCHILGAWLNAIQFGSDSDNLLETWGGTIEGYKQGIAGAASVRATNKRLHLYDVTFDLQVTEATNTDHCVYVSPGVNLRAQRCRFVSTGAQGTGYAFHLFSGSANQVTPRYREIEGCQFDEGVYTAVLIPATGVTRLRANRYNARNAALSIAGSLVSTDDHFDGKRQVTDGAMTSASATLTCATSAPFLAGDIGHNVIVQGAGTSGADLRTTIATYVSASEVTLTAVAATTVSSAQVRWQSSGRNISACNLSVVAPPVGSKVKFVHPTLDDCNMDVRGTGLRWQIIDAQHIGRASVVCTSETVESLSVDGSESDGTGLAQRLARIQTATTASVRRARLLGSYSDAGIYASTATALGRLDLSDIDFSQMTGSPITMPLNGAGLVSGRGLTFGATAPTGAAGAQYLVPKDGVSPTAITSAATLLIGPGSGQMNYQAFHVTGTTQITTIRYGGGSDANKCFSFTLRLIFDAAGSLGSSGNIFPKSTSARAVGSVAALTYDPVTNVYYEVS